MKDMDSRPAEARLGSGDLFFQSLCRTSKHKGVRSATPSCVPELQEMALPLWATVDLTGNILHSFQNI